MVEGNFENVVKVYPRTTNVDNIRSNGTMISCLLCASKRFQTVCVVGCCVDVQKRNMKVTFLYHAILFSIAKVAKEESK